MVTISELEEKLLPLRKIGLTQYQVKVYAGLISLGPTTAYQVSYVTKVPYPKVYSVLEDLRRMGLIEVNPGRPRGFRAKPTPSAVTSLRDDFVKHVDTSLRKALRELRPHYALVGRREERGVWNIVGRRNVLDKAKELLRGSRRKVLIAFSGISDLGTRNLIYIFKKLKEKQIPVRIVASRRDIEEAKRYRGLAEIKFVDRVESRYLIVDDNVLLIAIGKPELGPDSWSAVWAKCRNCLKHSEEHFEHAWRYGRQMSQLTVGDPTRHLRPSRRFID